MIPRLETLKKEGQAGQAKITQYTRYLTIGPRRSCSRPASSRWPAPASCSSGCTRGLALHGHDVLAHRASMVITMTAGTGVIMWLGELITDRGIGNGMSMLIFTSIVGRLPRRALGRSRPASGWVIFALVRGRSAS